MSKIIFTLPDLGEGLPDASIVAWHVKVGDVIKTDQLLVSVETAKAIIDVPCPFNATIEKLCAKKGDLVAVGQDLVIFDAADNAVRSSLQSANHQESSMPNQQDLNTLVGVIKTTNDVFIEQASVRVNYPNISHQQHHRIITSPAIRELAKEMQVDLNNVTPTGPNNTIIASDLYNAIKDDGLLKEHDNKINSNDAGWLSIEPTARTMALAMQQSHREIVPATIFEDFVLHQYTDHNIKLDITVNLILAIIAACDKEPSMNAWFTKCGNTFKRKIFTEINLGIAVDTEDGLFVPVMKNVQDKSAIELRDELNLLLHQVKNRTITPDQLQEATFILSNFGKFAGRYAIPIIVSPMVATLAVGSWRQEMIVLNNKPEIGYILPGSLTFDHRAITGGQAARFLKGILEYFRTLNI